MAHSKKKSIEIICVLDRSGSMSTIHAESVNQFNAFIKEQQEAGVKARVTLRVFDTKHDVIINRVKLKNVRPVSAADFLPRGFTALNDAVGKAIFESKEGKPTICMIMTDGGENSSNEFTGPQVKKMVKGKEDRGWEFKFFGAGIDAFKAGGHMGFKDGSYVNVPKSAAGMSLRASSMNVGTQSYFDTVNSDTDDSEKEASDDKAA